MKPRLSIYGVIDTVAHAQTVKTNVIAELATKDVFEEHHLDWEVDDLGQVVFKFDARFNNDVDRDAMRDWLRDQVRDHPVVKDWFLSATVRWHQCVHDGSYDRQIEGEFGPETIRPERCTDADLVVWEKP